MLKKPVFIPVPGFHGPTSRSGPVLKTMFNRLTIILVKTINVFCIYSNMHNILGRGRLGASHSLSLKFMHTVHERERERSERES